MHRRRFMQAGATLGLASGLPGLAKATSPNSAMLNEQGNAFPNHVPGKGIPPVQQSVSRWCYNHLSLQELMEALRGMGVSAIDLIRPSEFEEIKQGGFTCSMAYGRDKEDITTGFINEELHDELYTAYAKTIPVMAEYGLKNLVCFAGNRRGQDDLDGLRVAAKGLKRLMPIAKEHGVTLQMEAFNSKVNHPDYMGDSTAWLVTLCDLVGSDNFKILWDIYHMAIQEGNVIATIKQYHEYFGHYHTAGLPGRNELNEEQELYYPAVMRAIRATGYTGYVAHEFRPTYDDKVVGLREAVRLCS